jgi:hypothetical protein
MKGTIDSGTRCGLLATMRSMLIGALVAFVSQNGCGGDANRNNDARSLIQDAQASCDAGPCVPHCIPSGDGGVPLSLSQCQEDRNGCNRPVEWSSSYGCQSLPDGDRCVPSPLVATASTTTSQVRWCLYDYLERPFCAITLYDKGVNPYDGNIECAQREPLNATITWPSCSPYLIGYSYELGIEITFCADLHADACPCAGSTVFGTNASATGDCAFIGEEDVTECRAGSWAGWSGCSKNCGGGEQTRTRIIVAQPADGGAPCPPLSETQACNTDPCPNDAGTDAAEVDTSTSHLD